MTTSEEQLDRDAFDAFITGLDYPMFVVTVAHAGERSGCLVGFATQASIDPPRMLVCLSTANHTYAVAREASVLGVHVLDADQQELAELFGGETGDEVDKLARCRWREGPEGVPLLADCPRVLVGRVLAQQPCGDHVGFLLAPIAVSGGDAEALTLEDVAGMEPGHPA